MNKHIKDPGSAITHFIGMLMAIFAAIPLLIQAGMEPNRIYLISLTIYAVSMVLLYAASTTYHTFDISPKVNTLLKKFDHMMIFVLIAGSYTPICLLVLEPETGLPPCPCLGNRPCRHPCKSVLGILSKMVLFCTLHRNGLDLRPCIWTDFEWPYSGRVWMASCRWNRLHNRRYHLCIKASSL